jgi:hypothetical protein
MNLVSWKALISGNRNGENHARALLAVRAARAASWRLKPCFLERLCWKAAWPRPITALGGPPGWGWFSLPGTLLSRPRPRWSGVCASDLPEDGGATPPALVGRLGSCTTGRKI